MVEKAAGANDDLIAYTTERGAAICVHGRQLTVCGVCAELAETRARAAKRPESLLEAFAKDPGVRKFLEPGVPEVERRQSETRPHKPNAIYLNASAIRKGASYSLPAEFLPAGEELVAPADPLGPSSTLVFAESWERYKNALYNMHSAVSLAGALIRDEAFRTPVGGRSWETLHALAGKAREISEALSEEIGRVPEGEGFVK